MTDHTPPPDEPKTPMWLPALGAALFLIVGIWFATRPTEAPKADAAPVPSASAPPATSAAIVRPAIPGH